jgi:hypothetical protein
LEDCNEDSGENSGSATNDRQECKCKLLPNISLQGVHLPVQRFVGQDFNKFDPSYVTRIYQNCKIMFTFAAKISYFGAYYLNHVSAVQ